MNKETIELDRMEHLIDYGFMGSEPFYQDSHSTLDKLLEWTQKPENNGKKVYKHLLRKRQENISNNVFRYTNEYGFSQEKCKELIKDGVGGPWTIPMKYDYLINSVPYCELVYYLDIYWQ